MDYTYWIEDVDGYRLFIKGENPIVSYPNSNNSSGMGNFERHKIVPLPPKEFLLFLLEERGTWLNMSVLRSGSLSGLFKNRYQLNKAVKELFEDDLIACAYPPHGYHVVTFIKFEPKELN